MSGVQFNLLPDVKLDYIKAQRGKNLIFSIAVLVSAAALGIFLVVLVTVEGVQRKQLNHADSVVVTTTQELKSIPGLDQIITVQNQLQTLSSLHHGKHVSTRLFGYLAQTTPTNVSIGSVTVDFVANTLDINGSANNQTSVNTFIDTLKFTTYKIGDQDSARPAFPSVVESSFSIANNSVNYSLKVTFDPQLFSNNVPAVPKLTVPTLTTTRSVTEDPNNALFTGQNSTQSGSTNKAGGN